MATRRMRAGLEVLFWATLVANLSSIVASAYTRWRWEAILSDRPITGLFHGASVVADNSLALGVATWIASAAALIVIARAPEADKLRVRNLGALAVATMSSVIALRLIQSGEFKAGDAANTMRLMFVFVLLGMVQSVLLLWLLRRVAAAEGQPMPAWINVGVMAHVIWLLLGGLPYLQTPTYAWARLAIYAALDLPMLAAIWHAAHARARTLPTAIAEVPEGLAVSPLGGVAWRRAADGLATCRGAVVAKLVVLVGGAALWAATSATLGQRAGTLWSVVDLVLTFVLVAGLCAYAAVPDESDARVSAWTATGSALLLLCLQIYQAWLVFQALDDSDLDARLAAVVQLSLVGGVSILVGLVGLLFFMTSLRALARFLALPRVASLAGWATLGLVVTLFGGMSILLSLPVVGPFPTWSLFLLLVPLATFVAYLRVLGAVLGELRARLAAAVTSATR